MIYYDLITAIILLALLAGLSIPLGKYMAAVFNGKHTFISPAIRPVEKLIYRISGIDDSKEMSWKTYAWSFIIFNIIGIIFLFTLQEMQDKLPMNPQKFPGIRWDTALNAAISFVTNTNWQSYAGESAMSYLTQMLGFTVQNFLSAAGGMAIAIPLIRSFTRKEIKTVGNFWVDMTRSILYILLPLSFIVCLLLLSQGVIQNFNGYIKAETLEGPAQLIPMGPVASQIAIKQLGSNGGGFFNANSAHPFENPTFISNFVELFSILLIPMAFIFMFGYMTEKKKQAKTIFLALLILFITGLGVILYCEYSTNPALSGIGIAGNMEGKETRFGIFWSSLWSQATTATSNGSVNSMHDSFMPLGGLIQLFNIGIGEVIFGGVGVGLAGMIFYIILSMFIAGLMIGRTPEFLGKKLGPYEMIMAMISLLLPMISMVLFSAIGLSTEAGMSGMNNPSAHGLSEILYAFTSAHGNNGSAFAGLNANTVFYNLILSAGMLIGRFATVIPAIAVAGSLAGKKIVPENSASFPTTGPMFIIILICVILIMGALTFFPIYSLGPVLEHLFMEQNKLF